jgi:surface antigen
MRAASVFIGLSLALASCTNPDGTTNNTGTGGLLGAGGGAVIGGIAGELLGHNATSAALGAALGGLTGYLAGTYIGQQLDTKDRQAAAEQTSAVLDEPVETPPPGHAVYYHHAPPHRWASTHTTASGSATLEKVATTSSGNECRMVRELAVIKGQEVVQHTSYCQTASGGWKAVSV